MLCVRANKQSETVCCEAKKQADNVQKVHVSRLLLILALCGCEEVLQDALQVIKGGPVLRFVLPALHHDFIEFSRTTVQLLHAVAFLQGPDHLWVGHS